MKQLISNHMGSHGVKANSQNHKLSEKMNRRMLVVTVLGVMLLIGAADQVYGQGGALSGKVTDQQSGRVLYGVKVSIPSLGSSTYTDRDGRYVFWGLSGGDYDLEISSLGYESQQVSVTVESGQRTEAAVALQGGYAGGDRIFGTRARAEQVRVQSRQRDQMQVSTVIGTEHRNRFGDYTVRDALVRVPGIQVGSNREINLRGVGRNAYNVTLDGQRMATTGLGDRSVDLGMFSTDLIDDIEVIRVVSPDMDADALSGVVNLTTFQPVGGPRRLEVHMGGGANTEYFGFTGPDQRASLRYYETVTENLALSGALSYHQQSHSREGLGIVYDVADFGAGPEDVLENISPTLQNDTRKAVGGQLQLTYEPTQRSTYHIRGLINFHQQDVTRHSNHWVANQSWSDLENVAQGRFQYALDLDENNFNQFAFQTGARYQFNWFNFEYTLGWDRSRVERDRLLNTFQSMGTLNYSVNSTDRYRPEIDLGETTLPISRDMILQPVDNIHSLQVYNTYSGRVDFEIPFNLGAFKFGSSIHQREKDVFNQGAYTNFEYTFIGFIRLNELERRREGTDILDSYNLPWLVDADGYRDFFGVNSAIMRRDIQKFRRNSDPYNYLLTENVYAGYGMLTLEFGDLSIMGGARYEYTDTENEGRLTAYDRFGRYDATSDTLRSNNYNGIFPNVQLKYAPGDQVRIQLAYSKTMARPDFSMLSPFEMVIRQDTTLYRGNPGLEPVYSNNYDFIFDYNFHGYGLVSVNAFYKDISNFISLTERRIDVAEGQYTGLDPLFTEEVSTLTARETTFRNSDRNATIYGVEVSLKQSLSFLPGFIGNFGIFANYTWTESSYETERNNEVSERTFKSPHVVNAAVDYTQGRFFGQVSYHWSAEYISRLADEMSVAPAIDAANAQFLDEYSSGWTDMSVSMQFRVSDNFRLWANAHNLLGREPVIYRADRDLYPLHSEHLGGRGFLMGIRFDL